MALDAQGGTRSQTMVYGNRGTRVNLHDRGANSRQMHVLISWLHQHPLYFDNRKAFDLCEGFNLHWSYWFHALECTALLTQAQMKERTLQRGRGRRGKAGGVAIDFMQNLSFYPQPL